MGVERPVVGVVGGTALAVEVVTAAARAGFVVVTTEVPVPGRVPSTVRVLATPGDVVDAADLIVDTAAGAGLAAVAGTVWRPGHGVVVCSAVQAPVVPVLRAVPEPVWAVGVHPFGVTAGTDAEVADWCAGTTWAVCPRPGSMLSPVFLAFVRALRVGAVVVCTADAHDRAAGAVEQVPSVVAAAVTAAVGGCVPVDRLLAGVASTVWADVARAVPGDPAVHAAALLANRVHVAPVLAEVEAQLRALHRALLFGDEAAVRDVLAAAHQVRTQIAAERLERGVLVLLDEVVDEPSGE